MQTPEHRRARRARPSKQLGRHLDELWGLTAPIAWISALVLVLSVFMDWYSGDGGDGVVLAVTGWHTGGVGKLVFLIGIAAFILLALRRFGVVLPASLPESLVLIGLGVLSTVLVLVRMIWPPNTLVVSGLGIGIWVSLVASLGLIVAGLLETADEL